MAEPSLSTPEVPSLAPASSPTVPSSSRSSKLEVPSDSIDLTADSDDGEEEAKAVPGTEPIDVDGDGGNQGIELSGARAITGGDGNSSNGVGAPAPAGPPKQGNRQYEFKSWEPPSSAGQQPPPYSQNGAGGYPGQHPGHPGLSPNSQHRPPPYHGYPHPVGMNGYPGPGGHAVHPPQGQYPAYGPSPAFTSVYPSVASPNHPFTRSPLPGANGNTNGGPLSYLPLGSSTSGTSSAPIDLTSIRIPSPPPAQNPKQPMCIGAIVSRAMMLYPSPAALIGATVPPGSRERYEVRDWRGAEFLKVKLKLRLAGSEPTPANPTANTRVDMIQVTTPSLASYLGDLDPSLGDVLIPHMKRGLLRLEGFVQRLHPDAPQFEIRVNVLLFTLPSNIKYISTALLKNGFYLTDPLPPYEGERHADCPPYQNAHMADEETRRLITAHVARMSGLQGRPSGFALPGLAFGQMDKAKQVEVQRQQVDDVFKSLDTGVELEQSDPGSLIETDLFPHQRKALTFLLEREGDASALKEARRLHEKKMVKKAKKRAKKEQSASVAGSVNGDDDKSRDGEMEEEATEGKKSKKGKGKKHLGRSLWEPMPDENGRVRLWRNKITDEKRRGKEVPDEGKGAILADDMGLGKTLSIVSLIAATRDSALDWARSKSAGSDIEMEEVKPEYSASTFKGRVFGMPEIETEADVKPSAKKRKREEADEKNAAARQARIKVRSRGNLLLCPMSTITNWEDQIKEHWNGEVQIVGGSGMAPKDCPPRKKNITKRNGEESTDEDDADFDVLRVYIYHGAAKINDPAFLADFDIVITSYNTLAIEFSKMSAAVTEDPTPAETANNSDDEVVVLGDTATNSRAVRPEVEAEIKAAEVADRLRKAEAKKKGKGGPKKVESSALQAVEWFRIVLDEAHYIKSASTVASKAACYLAADRRIALTGTPIQNKIEDIWALFKFLRLDPVDRKEVFNEFIWNPCKQGNSVGVAKLQLVMRCCTLRRTKDSVAEDGRRILNLPPRKEMQLWLDLRADEREVYDKRAVALRARVEDLRSSNELGKNYANILQEVLRLRQICNHVDLAMLGAVEEDYDGTVMDYQVAVQGIERAGLTLARAQSVVSFRKDGDGAQCETCGLDYNDAFPSIGLGGVEEEKKTLKKLTHRPLLTKCLHMFCPTCFKSGIYPEYKPKMKSNPSRPCSACGAALRLPMDVIEVVPPDSEQAAEIAEQAPKRAARKKYVRQPGEKPNLSTKMQFLLDDLMKYSKRNPNSINFNPMELDGDADGVEEMDAEGKPFITKSIVFSQWTTMLDRIGDMLDEASIRYDRLDGTMTREDRARAMQALKCNKKIEVLLVSTRAGGVGLNLTTASRAYLVDPYWNPSVEAQAIDRIHRMGQTRPVTAIKLMIKDSIEMKLDEIQKKKANLANLSLKPMTRKELMEQKAEELASLFR